ncbi:CACTA en-spm transposon protein [Cucumis melo var. makuwa]|uniref:CACTA en-spm transposon protein n=1 Tax=Cucumis melo var. makuwa TaxID=1194695 RepID=A0A5A7V7L8_CUCMM|nr:CACTA en-spm transposon protein [Cucumis melo var. makuwa]
MDAMFLEFEDDLDNIVEGSSSVGDNMGESKNFLHFNCVIIDLLSRIFFSTTCDSDFQETCVVSTLGVRAPCCNKWAHSDDDRPWRGEAYFLTRRSLQLGDRRRQYELAERKGEPIDRVELFRETHVWVGTFMSQAAEDAHNQMLELQSQPTPKGSQPFSEDEICDQVLGRRPDYSKGLGWGPKPKAHRTTSASSSSTSCSQSTQKEIELQAKLNEALEQIEVQVEITKR